MLDEVFVRKVVRDAMEKYAAEHDGKRGLAKADVIEQVIQYGGDINDVRAVMTEGAKLLLLDVQLK